MPILGEELPYILKLTKFPDNFWFSLLIGTLRLYFPNYIHVDRLFELEDFHFTVVKSNLIHSKECPTPSNDVLVSLHQQISSLHVCQIISFEAPIKKDALTKRSHRQPGSACFTLGCTVTAVRYNRMDYSLPCALFGCPPHHLISSTLAWYKTWSRIPTFTLPSIRITFMNVNVLTIVMLHVRFYRACCLPL